MQIVARQQGREVVRAQHGRHTTKMRHPDQPSREVGLIERLFDEEPHRRGYAVHRRDGSAGFTWLDSEAALMAKRA